MDPKDIRIGNRIRTKRASEMLEPDWYIDHSSLGKFYVNYNRKQFVRVDRLGEEYIVEGIMPHIDCLWVYTEYTDPATGQVHRDSSVRIPISVVAEILDNSGPIAPRCNCGKDVSGGIGEHSSWCNVPMGYVSRKDRT